MHHQKFVFHSPKRSMYIAKMMDGQPDVEFQRGKKRTIIGAPQSMPLTTRAQAIRLAKTVLQIAREFEQKRGKARKYEKVIRPFDVCGHMIAPLTRFLRSNAVVMMTTVKRQRVLSQ